jgi:hypothetical protein
MYISDNVYIDPLLPTPCINIVCVAQRTVTIQGIWRICA